MDPPIPYGNSGTLSQMAPRFTIQSRPGIVSRDEWLHYWLLDSSAPSSDVRLGGEWKDTFFLNQKQLPDVDDVLWETGCIHVNDCYKPWNGRLDAYITAWWRFMSDLTVCVLLIQRCMGCHEKSVLHKWIYVGKNGVGDTPVNQHNKWKIPIACRTYIFKWSRFCDVSLLKWFEVITPWPFCRFCWNFQP